MEFDVFNQVIQSVIGKIIVEGGGAAAIAYAISHYVLKAKIEHVLAKELKEYESNLLRHYAKSMKVYEKELEIIPKIWCSFRKAYREVKQVSSPLQEVFTFNANISSAEAKKTLTNFRIPEGDIEEILRHPATEWTKKTKEAREIMAINKSGKLLDEFLDELDFNKIFLSTEIFNLFDKLQNKIYDALLDTADKTKRYAAFKALTNKDTKGLIDQLERAIQSRLAILDSK